MGSVPYVPLAAVAHRCCTVSRLDGFRPALSPRYPASAGRRAGSGDSARRTRSNYPRRTTAVVAAPSSPRSRMPFVAHVDRSCQRGRSPRRGNRPFPASSQAPTLPALRASGELQRPPRSAVAIASATQMGARAPNARTGTCPTDPPATAHQRSWPTSFPPVRAPLVHAAGRWGPGIALRRPRRLPHTRGIATGDSILWRWTWFVAGNGPRRPPEGSSPLRWA